MIKQIHLWGKGEKFVSDGKGEIHTPSQNTPSGHSSFVKTSLKCDSPTNLVHNRYLRKLEIMNIPLLLI